mgnify:CR=1 FL=1
MKTRVIAVAGVGLAVALLWPSDLIVERIQPNDRSAIGLLRSLAASQEEFRASALVDQDGDGRGEYGTFEELCGTVPCRGTGVVADPTFLSANFGRTAALDARGAASRGGYQFLIELPDASGLALTEKDVLARGASPADADRQETGWSCRAWPESVEAGTRVFAIDQDGRIWELLAAP